MRRWHEGPDGKGTVPGSVMFPEWKTRRAWPSAPRPQTAWPQMPESSVNWKRRKGA